MKRITIPAGPDQENLFLLLFEAFVGGCERLNNVDLRRRAARVLDVRDRVSEVTEPTVNCRGCGSKITVAGMPAAFKRRRLTHESGDLHLTFEDAEFDLLEAAVTKRYGYPAELAQEARQIDAILADAEDVNADAPETANRLHDMPGVDGRA